MNNLKNDTRKVKPTMNNGEQPAMPFVPNLEGTNAGPEQRYGYCGMTKREAVAMAAMQGLLASPYADQWSNAAQEAVRQADALLKALEK